MTYATETHAVRFNLVERFASLRSDLALRIRKTRAFQRTFNELSEMSNRELADIGISRLMIREISREAANLTK